MERPGAWYHVTARGNERRPIFQDDRDRGHFCELLAQSTETFRLVLHAYVLMDNHYHLLMETPEANLSRAMQWFNVSYSVWFNRRHGRAGHLFQGRYKAIVVDRDTWALGLSRYVHLNPVRVKSLLLDKPAQHRSQQGAGSKPEAELIRERLVRLRRYRWSSYRAYAGLTPPPPWLVCKAVLALVGEGHVEQQRLAYRQYVEDAVREGLAESPWEQLSAQIVLGTQEFVRGLRQHWQGNQREQAPLRGLAPRPGFVQVIAVVEKLKGEKWETFRDRHGDWGRDLALYLGKKECGLKLRELGEAAGGMDYAGVSVAVKRFERSLATDKELAALLALAKTQLLNVEM